MNSDHLATYTAAQIKIFDIENFDVVEVRDVENCSCVEFVRGTMNYSFAVGSTTGVVSLGTKRKEVAECSISILKYHQDDFTICLDNSGFLEFLDKDLEWPERKLDFELISDTDYV